MKMIAAAESEAKASLATVEEIRRDRELGYQPYLSFEIQRFTAVWLDAQPDMVNVVNYGRGPALSAIFCERLETSWRRTKTFDLSPEGSGAGENQGLMEVRPRPAGRQPGPAVVDAKDPNGPFVAIFCEDHLGNRYRFRPRIARPDRWRPGDPPVDWVTWYAPERFLD